MNTPSKEAIVEQPKPQPGYWLELERIEVPNDSHDKILLIAVDARTGERHIAGQA